MKKRAIALLLAISVIIGVFGITGAAQQPKVKSVKLSTTVYKYNGKVRAPVVTVINTAGKKLLDGTDYNVKYCAGRKLPGTYAVKITFIGKYTGTCVRAFVIKPANVGAFRVAASSPTALKMQWKARGEANGYELQYYSQKTKKWTHYCKTTATSIVAKNLKSFTKYKFRICAYSVVKGKVYYGAFTALNGLTKPPAVRATSLRNIITDNSTVPPVSYHRVKWGKATSKVTGYQIQFGMPEGWYPGMSAKWLALKAVKGTNRNYFDLKVDGYGDDIGMARVRTFCTASGKTYYSSWSNIVYLPL